MDSIGIEEALLATGELLAAAGESLSVVAVGGAGLAVLGLVQRATNDVDIIAIAQETPAGVVFRDARPLPPALSSAAATVARDLGLPPDWLNSEVGLQFEAGLPPGMTEGLIWRTYGSLRVGFAGRMTLLRLKLFAAADNSPVSVHVQDLVAMRPSAEELERAAYWVVQQDAAPEFEALVKEVIEYVIG